MKIILIKLLQEKSKKKKNSENNIDNEIIKNNKNIPKNECKNRSKNKKRYKTIKNEVTAYISIDNDGVIDKNNFDNIHIRKRNKNINKNTLPENNSKSENKAIIEKINKTMEYISDEINILPHNLATQYNPLS